MPVSLADWKTIRLGYSNNIFPYLYRNRVTSALNGIYYEIWTMVSQRILKKRLEIFQKSSYDYLATKNSNGFSGLLGDIYNGTIDASMEDFNYRSDRIRSFYVTSPVDYTTNDFYLRDSNVMLGRLDTYIVFTPFLIFLLVTSLICVIITERVVFVCKMRNKKKYKSAIRRQFGSPVVQNTLSMILPQLRDNAEERKQGRKRWKSLQWEVTSGMWRQRMERIKEERSIRARCSFPFNRPISHFLYVLAVLAIGQIYGGQFASSSSSPNPVSGTDLFEMSHSLREGANKLLVQDTNFLSDDFYNEVYPGGNITGRVLVQPEMKAIKEQVPVWVLYTQLCKNGNLFGYVTSYQLTTKDPTDPYRTSCSFIKVDSVSGLHRFARNSNVSKQNYGTEEPIAFYI
ncbi:hypothetical protein PFISCL1PPCAC_145, partial [Pristionchus fissidentatus]